MKDPNLYIQHIQECLRRISDYTADRKEQFLKDTKTQDAVLRSLQTLAESPQHLPDHLKNLHSEINWRGISGFRNVPIHDYLETDLELVWTIIESELPSLDRVINLTDLDHE